MGGGQNRKERGERGRVSLSPRRAVQPALFCFLKEKRIADLFLPAQISYLDDIFRDTHSVSDTEKSSGSAAQHNGSV